MPFLHRKSLKTTFLTEAIFISKSSENIIKEIHNVNNLQKSRGINIDVYYGDNEFNINALM